MLESIFAAVFGAVTFGGFLRSFFCKSFPGANGCGYKGKGPTIHPSVRRIFRRPWMR